MKEHSLSVDNRIEEIQIYILQKSYIILRCHLDYLTTTIIMRAHLQYNENDGRDKMLLMAAIDEQEKNSTSIAHTTTIKYQSGGGTAVIDEI